MAFLFDNFTEDGDIYEEMEYKYSLMRNGKENSMHRPLCHGRSNTWKGNLCQSGISYA